MHIIKQNISNDNRLKNNLLYLIHRCQAFISTKQTTQ